MSVTTDMLDMIRREIETAGQESDTDCRVEHLVWSVEKLTDLVGKLHARVLYLEAQQQRQENY